jgi:protein-S-isoprenylcysteine O-methyltransferase Ste14
MPASDFEFRNRFLLISAVFCLGFAAYRIDHVNVVERVLMWLSVPAAAWLTVKTVVFGVGAGLTFVNALIRTWAAAYLRSDVVHDSNLHADRVVADGPYRYVRNPLYLGSLFLATGLGLLASTSGFLIIVFGTYIVLHRLIEREEAALIDAHGPAFRAYMQAVPRLLPGTKPLARAGAAPARWAQAVLGELPAWVFALAATLFAITLQIRVAYLIILAGIALYLVLVIAGRRQR